MIIRLRKLGIDTRGNQKQKIFKSRADYQKYIRQLSYYKTRYHCALRWFNHAD